VIIRPVRRWIDFQGEALIATKGFDEPSDPAQKLTYLEMPLLARCVRSNSPGSWESAWSSDRPTGRAPCGNTLSHSLVLRVARMF
jgi:hypothetical protein